MSIQNALSFMRRVREDPDLADRLRSLGRAPALDEIVALAAEAGFEFSEADLREAHRQDGMLRWVGFRGDEDAPA